MAYLGVSMARRTLAQLLLGGFAAAAAFSASSAGHAQSSDNWLLSESNATGDADLKIDVTAAKRALGDGASPAETQKRMTKSMGELLRLQPGRNRLFDASNAPAEAVDVTAQFVDLIGRHQDEHSSVAGSEPPQNPEQSEAPRIQAQAHTERAIVVTAPRVEALIVPRELPASESVPLVTLTFPATITPRAEAFLLEIFRELKWPEGCGGFMARCSDNTNYIDQIVAKTAYYVPDVYAALARELPANSVVIQPATLDVDGAGHFSYRLLNGELPSATTIDFIAFVRPRFYPTAPSTAFTHGLYVLPVFVAASQPRTSSKGGELFAISRGVSPTDIAVRPSALAQLAATAEQKQSAPLSGVVTFEDKQLKITDAQWKHVESPMRIPEFVADLMAGELKPFVAAVKSIDRRAVERSEIVRYASLYSDAVNKAGPVAWAILPEFISAEREFTNSDTLEGLKTLREGEFGQSVRKTLLAEREQNKSAGRTMWTNALSAGVGGYFAGKSGATGPSQIQQMMQAVMDQQEAMRRAGQAFSESVGGVSAAQRSVVIQMGERQETVIAGTIAELRQKFRQVLLAQAAAP